jgi:hypothetical protein
MLSSMMIHLTNDRFKCSLWDQIIRLRVQAPYPAHLLLSSLITGVPDPSTTLLK